VTARPALALCFAAALGGGREARAQGPTYLTPRDSAAHVYRGERSGFPDALRLVVRDSAGWALAWRQLMVARPEAAAAPPVDFRREMVVVAALGLRAQGGHAIAVDSVRRAGEEVEVVVRTVSPPAGCPAALALVQPVDVVRVARSERAVRFAERAMVAGDCAPVR
jgi:hypothetical protein